ncbi:MAG: hypothetical protein AABZ31_10375 [Bdellovibrionota bacterium]
MTKKIKQKKTKTSAKAVKGLSPKTALLAASKTALKATQAQKTSQPGKNVKKTVAVTPKETPKTAVAPMTAATETAVVKSAVSGREAARLALAQKAATSKWASLYSKANKIPVNPYNLKKEYEIETAIDHKTLGWGYIQDKKNDRLEVLFENGIKYLISNYK